MNAQDALVNVGQILASGCSEIEGYSGVLRLNTPILQLPNDFAKKASGAGTNKWAPKYTDWNNRTGEDTKPLDVGEAWPQSLGPAPLD